MSGPFLFDLLYDVARECEGRKVDKHMCTSTEWGVTFLDSGKMNEIPMILEEVFDEDIDNDSE